MIYAKKIQGVFQVILLVCLLTSTDKILTAQTDGASEMTYFAGVSALLSEDKELDISFPVYLFYPTTSEPKQLVLEGVNVRAANDAPVAEGTHPLVVISHGTGGFNLGYRTIAEFLAENGFIVALPEHYKNNRNDNSLENTDENLITRPRHISLSVDALINDPKISGHIQPEHYALIGHSMGGYTALAVAGGTPWNFNRERLDINSDSRVKALVLLAPATEWYAPPSSLEKINTPILMLTAEHDAPLPAGWHQRTANIVFSQIDENLIKFRMVENSGHFSFLSPFPESRRSPDFLPSTDPDGFDREAFHIELNQEILNFLSSKL